MSPGTLLILFAILVVIGFWYSRQKLKGRVLCTFRRANKTKIEAFVKLNSRFIVWEGGKYYVNPKRITLFWYNRGIHQFFPTFVPCLDYSWDRPNPIDPETFSNDWDTPEARYSTQEEERFKSFAKGVQAQVGKKPSVFERYLPWISIALVLVVGFILWQKISGVEQYLSGGG